MSYEETGKRIKERRKEMNISAALLAERIGLSKATIHRYENGDIKNIKMPVLEAMADVLKVNPLWLIGKSDVKDNNVGYDVCHALEELIENLRTYDQLLCNGNPVSPRSRKQIIGALEAIKNVFYA